MKKILLAAVLMGLTLTACTNYDYYKTPRGYHERSGNSTDGWNVIGCQSFLNQPLLAWAHEIESPVLLIHGEKAHSR